MIGNPSTAVIKQRFARLTAAELALFHERSTSFVVDAMNGRGALDHRIKPLDPKCCFVGSAQSARAGARDNLAALAALDRVEPGGVLVIATQGFTGTAKLGDHMARHSSGSIVARISAEGTTGTISNSIRSLQNATHCCSRRASSHSIS